MVLWLSIAFATTFTLAPTGAHSDGGSAGDGVGVGDVDEDGWLDLLTLPERGGATNAYLLQNNGLAGGFTDRTSLWMPGLTASTDYSRNVVIADLNGDGWRDIVVGGLEDVGVFKHTVGTNGHLFGGTAGATTLYTADSAVVSLRSVVHVPNLNAEGFVPFDGDRDGLLDLQFGFRSMRITDPLGAALLTYGDNGLPSAANTDDDFLMMEDINGDRRLDLVVGREGPDIFFQTNSGTFVPDLSIDLPAQPMKGGIVLCDLDGDSDLDLFRTGTDERGTQPTTATDAHQVWLFDSSGWASAGNPGVDLSRPTFGVACADLENDGDMDLVVGYYDGGLEILRNDGTATFTRDGGTIPATWLGGTRAVAAADFNRDGGIDIYAGVQFERNRLYENQGTNDAYLNVELMANVGDCETPILVDDVHGQVRVSNLSGSQNTGVRVLNGVSGTGTSGHNPIHVGLGNLSPTSTLAIEYRPATLRPGGGQEWVGRVLVVPSDHPFHTITLRTDDPDGDGIPNQVEGTGDADQDAIPDWQEWDADNDGLSDVDEVGDPCNPTHSDSDGVPDFLDLDSDGDGDPDQTDCEPTNPQVYTATWYADLDLDGFGNGAPMSVCGHTDGLAPVAGDCEPTDASVYPGAIETCDLVDHDCDNDAFFGAVDATFLFADADEDGFGAGPAVEVCPLSGSFAPVDGDCNDGDDTIFPGADEQCDLIDQDCDHLIDNDAIDATVWFIDADRDGHAGSDTVLACVQPPDTRLTNTDCDDTDASVSPDRPELCDNLIDDDCNNQVDENAVNVPWYLDEDGDGFGVGTAALVQCTQPAGYAPTPGDCDDQVASVRPNAVENCDGVDTNCSGDESDAVDANRLYEDLDFDGFGAGPTASACGVPTGTALLNGDCDDSDPLIQPSQPETCDAIDNNCNGLIDDNPIAGGLTLWQDADGDGHGVPLASIYACTGTVGYAALDDDCNDAEPLAWTGAVEECDGVDNDCDGLLDDRDPDLAPDAVVTWYADSDGDGVGGELDFEACTPPAGYVALGGDCDDADPVRFPGAVDVADNGIDEDCSGADRTFDQDGDGVPDDEESDQDSDGDGLPDLLDPDSDNDGVLDGAETSEAARTSDGSVVAPVPPAPDYGCNTAGRGIGAAWFSRRR